MHGTSVAGIALASSNNSRGVAGVAWQGIPVAVNALGNGGSGFPVSAAAAIGWADSVQIPILSMSGGYYEDSGITTGDVKLLNDVCLNAFYHGRLFVAAMGNRDEQIRSYPAAFARRVYGIGAMLQDGIRWEDSRICLGGDAGSTFGPWIDLMAPGGAMIVTIGRTYAPSCPTEPYYDLNTCSPSNKCVPFGGTSAAAPVVSGVASLLLSLNGNLLGEDIEQVLNRTARDITVAPAAVGWDSQTGYGMVNAGAALDYIAPPRRVEQGSIGYQGTLGTLSFVDSQTVTNRTFLHLGGGLPETLLVASCTRVRMRGKALFPVAFSDTPSVWVRASGTTGWRDVAVFDYDQEVRWGQEVTGSRISSRDTLETFVFRIPNRGWFPAPPTEARVAFTAVGPEPTQVGVGPEVMEDMGLDLRTAPNPGVGRVLIDYRLPAGGPVVITIVDVSGRQVAKVIDQVMVSGRHSARWDGRTAGGVACAPGVYFCRLASGTRALNLKFVFLGPGR